MKKIHIILIAVGLVIAVGTGCVTDSKPLSDPDNGSTDGGGEVDAGVYGETDGGAHANHRGNADHPGNTGTGTDSDTGVEVDTNGEQEPGSLCEANARRCTGSGYEICSPTGDQWTAGENCAQGCVQGYCIDQIYTDTELSGEIHAPGKAVVIGDNVSVTPMESATGVDAGRLRVEADVIVVEGTLDASGAGFPGGGGGGGGGGGHRHEHHGASASGGAGASAGASGGGASACGSEKHGSPGGHGGDGGGQFAGNGGAGGECEHYNYSGHPGQPGGRGGYAGNGTNGDTSVDDSVNIGSGGAGGGGGSGGGNGNGEGGGGGGGGAAGGAGGGAIELVATQHLQIDGTVLANGRLGGNGAGGQSGVRTGHQTGYGGDGGVGGDSNSPQNGQGGPGGSFEGGGTHGGAGGAGGAGAGGGILLVAQEPGGIQLDGTIETLGGDGVQENGGTVKVRYVEPAVSLQPELRAGRVHIMVPGEDTVPCLPACPGAQICDDTTGTCQEPSTCSGDQDCLGNRVCQQQTCDDPPDNEPPTVQITSPTTDGSFTTTAGHVDVAGTASDNVAVTDVQYRVDGSSWSTCSGTENWACPTIPLNVGTQQIDVRALDAAGNEGLVGLSVTRDEEQSNEPEPGNNSSGPDTSYQEVPSDFSGVTWLHHDVSGWPETATLSDVYISGSHIHLPYDKAGEWPISQYDSSGPDVVGNPWIFIRHQGQWYAATWEWMRPNQTFKNASAVAGDHIKQDPFWDWQPQSGVWYGFMMSGMARSPVRNVEERSNVVMFQWP